MKIYINSVREDWIIDRIKREWQNLNPRNKTLFAFKSDIIWLIAPWTWKKVSRNTLQNKKVICSIYHIDEDKFNEIQLKEFRDRDKVVDWYHTISNKSKLQLKELTDKPIFVAPFWINQNLFFDIPEKEVVQEKLGINTSDFLIGSFQRDTEGSNMTSPKLSKGPDRFIEIVQHYQKIKPNIAVVLTGKRRNYVINQLEKKGIKFYYFEMANFNTLNELYNCLDLYIVSSRYEGGPQAILECAVTNTPIISTDVGIAAEILDDQSIFNMNNFQNAKPNIVEASKNANKIILPQGMDAYKNFFKEIYEN
tara:strand:+ start:276 stop:1199 length:924 start_codon:yes stop_codon:yes gene_type:complete